MFSVHPFHTRVAEEELDDLKRRIRQTRWPDELNRLRLEVRSQSRLYERACSILAW